MAKRVRYREGDWFAVPLCNGGFAVGLVARRSRGGIVFGYFFGPRRDEIPSLCDVASLQPEDAVLVRRFSYLGLANGEWPLLGQLPNWDRDLWPMPEFVREEPITGRILHVVYDDNDPSRLIRRYPVAEGVVDPRIEDGLMGAGFTEESLTWLLTS